MDDYDLTVAAAMESKLGLSKDEIAAGWDKPLGDLEDGEFGDFYGVLATRIDLTIEELLELWPRDEPKAGMFVISGLRYLAPYSAKAASALEDMAIRYQADTPASIAATLRRRRYVGSGRVIVIPYAPVPVPRSLARATLWAAFTTFVSSVKVLGCEPVCRACPTFADTVPGGLMFGIAAAILWYAVTLAVAARHLGGKSQAVPA